MSSKRAFETIIALQNEIEDWKRWEINYSNMLSDNEEQRKQFERQRSFAVFMQQIKDAKLQDTLLSFMYPGCF